MLIFTSQFVFLNPDKTLLLAFGTLLNTCSNWKHENSNKLWFISYIISSTRELSGTVLKPRRCENKSVMFSHCMDLWFIHLGITYPLSALKEHIHILEKMYCNFIGQNQAMFSFLLLFFRCVFCLLFCVVFFFFIFWCTRFWLSRQMMYSVVLTHHA